MLPSRYNKRPHRPNGRDTLARLWQAMRVMRRFTTHSLQVTASQDGSEICYSLCWRYLQSLKREGYVVIDREPQGWPRQPAVYRLTRDSGPLRPIAHDRGRHVSIFDQNTLLIWRDGEPLDQYGNLVEDLDDYLARRSASQMKGRP